MVDEWLGKLSDSLPKIIEKGGELILQLVKGIVENLPAVLESMGQVISSIGTWLDENSGAIGEKLGELVGKLSKYIIEHLPEIQLAMSKLSLVIIHETSGNNGQICGGNDSRICKRHRSRKCETEDGESQVCHHTSD